MIDKEEVRKIAILSRLPLPVGDELQEIQVMLSDILRLVQQLDCVDTEGTTPMSHPLEMVQRLRQDVVTEEDEHERFQKEAPLTAKGFYLVPRIID